jgi:hypothetical protein
LKGTVYVVCASPERRRAIAGALRAGRDPPEIKTLSGTPSRLELLHNSVLVIDLRDPNPLEPAELPRTGRRFAAACVILVATSKQSVPAAWLEVAREPNVQLLLTRPGNAVDEARLRSTVAQALERNLDRVVAGVLRRCGKRLEGLEDVVRAVLSDPWGVRRPRDVTRVLSITIARLRTICEPLGLGRIDYVLTFIRWCAWEFLTIDVRMSAARAFEAVGVRDRSNFRRQVRRARAGRRRSS